MSAAYDTYDYPSYWEGREYEHRSEIIAVKAFLQKIPKVNRILDVGSGFGRLTPIYSFRAKKVILADPAATLLKLARDRHTGKKFKFIQSKVENLPGKVKGKSIDLVLCIRVLHHIQNLEEALSIISKLVKKKGFFILEFPNKRHFKVTFLEFIKGNFTFILDIFPKDIRSKKSKKAKTLPFVNYHPDTIYELLKNAGFDIEEVRSVSNIRNRFLKSVVPLETLLFLEKHLQRFLAKISFGPSIFVLVRKD